MNWIEPSISTNDKFMSISRWATLPFPFDSVCREIANPCIDIVNIYHAPILILDDATFPSYNYFLLKYCFHNNNKIVDCEEVHKSFLFCQ